MQTLDAVVKNGQIVMPRRLDAMDETRCLVTVLDETLPDIRRAARMRLAEKRQRRLSTLLTENKRRALTRMEETELDSLLVEVHQLMARRAQAAWVLQELRRR